MFVLPGLGERMRRDVFSLCYYGEEDTQGRKVFNVRKHIFFVMFRIFWGMLGSVFQSLV